MKAFLLSGRRGRALSALIQANTISAADDVVVDSQDTNGTFLSIRSNASPPTDDARCWAIGFLPTFANGFNYGLLWPERIVPPSHRSFASVNSGWYWHRFCPRIFYYRRDVASGALSARRVFRWSFPLRLDDLLTDPSVGDPEFFSQSLVTISNWYNPSTVDVAGMLSYVPAIDCSGPPTATMEVVLGVAMWRERQWTTVRPAPWAGWTQRLPEASGSWPQILQVAWRYI